MSVYQALDPQEYSSCMLSVLAAKKNVLTAVGAVEVCLHVYET